MNAKEREAVEDLIKTLEDWRPDDLMTELYEMLEKLSAKRGKK